MFYSSSEGLVFSVELWISFNPLDESHSLSCRWKRIYWISVRSELEDLRYSDLLLCEQFVLASTEWKCGGKKNVPCINQSGYLRESLEQLPERDRGLFVWDRGVCRGIGCPVMADRREAYAGKGGAEWTQCVCCGDAAENRTADSWVSSGLKQTKLHQFCTNRTFQRKGGERPVSTPKKCTTKQCSWKTGSVLSVSHSGSMRNQHSIIINGYIDYLGGYIYIVFFLLWLADDLVLGVTASLCLLIPLARWRVLFMEDAGEGRSLRREGRLHLLLNQDF